MWWPTQARAPRGQRRTCSSARRRRPAAGAARRPAARSALGHLAARAPQHRPPAAADQRTTESSVRMWIGRSCTRKASAMPASRSSASSSSVGDRLVGHVAAGHHQRRARVGEQQVVQRRVGQHHPQLARARGDRVRHARRPAAGGEHDRPLRPSSSPSSSASSCDQRRAPRRRRHHQREGPVLAVLAGAQRGHRAPRRRRGRPGGSRRALDGDDRARRAAARRRGHRVLPRPGRRARRSASRAARTSGHAFGWAWKRRSRGSSYSARQRAHIANAGHRRQRPVVGHAAHDREARPAVRAVDERVAVAAVGGVQQLGAGSRRRSPRPGDDRRVGLARRRRSRDDEAASPRGAELLAVTRAPRAPAAAPRPASALDEPRDRRARALHLDLHPVLVVQHEAGQPVLPGQPVARRAEADALHHALDPHGDAGAATRTGARRSPRSTC